VIVCEKLTPLTIHTNSYNKLALAGRSVWGAHHHLIHSGKSSDAVEIAVAIAHGGIIGHESRRISVCHDLLSRSEEHKP